MKNITVGLFSVVMALQLAIPSSMLLKREMVLHVGQEFRFRTAPVDPFDAFRGRYVALRVEANQSSAAIDEVLQYQQKVYAHIMIDDQGFAKIVRVSTKKPQGVAYIQAKAGYPFGGQVRVDLPFDRYYMEEKAAPKAERLYWSSSQQRQNDTYITVRIKDGFAVINGLYIDGQRIEEAVKNEKT